jgi:hypothetical protein
MATLAFACAGGEGLKLVTEFPSIYGRTIRLPKDKILEGCLTTSPATASSETSDVAEFIVYQRCNPTKLEPERLQALNREWEPIARFREAVEEMASAIPPGIRNERVMKSYLNDAANRVFKQWTHDQRNLSSYVREIFDEGILSEPSKALVKVAEKFFGGPERAFASGGIAGTMLAHDAIGAAAGCAVGLVFHAAGSYWRASRKEKDSPFHYLTMLQDEGVGFVVSA